MQLFEVIEYSDATALALVGGFANPNAFRVFAGSVNEFVIQNVAVRWLLSTCCLYIQSDNMVSNNRHFYKKF